MSVKSTTDSANVKRKTPAYIMIFIMIFVLFGFQEILFRLIFPIPEVTNFNRINYSPVFFGETETSLKYLSNASFIWASDPDKTESLVNLNLYGFRTHDFSIEPDPEKKRIVFIGDSFTEGFLAADDETIPVAFENKAIEKGKDYEVLNLGIGGTDFTYYYKLLAGQMPVLKPDHVIMVLHGNDLPPIAYTQEYFDHPLVPEFSSKWVPRIYYVVKNYLDDKTVPKIWKSSPFIFFAPVPAPSNPWSNEVKTKEFEKLLSKNVVDAMKIGRFNPYAYEEYSMLKKRLPEDFKITDHLNGIQNFVEQFGNKVYLVYIPSKNQVHDYYTPFVKEHSIDTNVIALTASEYQKHAKILESSCQSLGIPFLDTTPFILEEENKGNHLYWEYDAHMRPKGYKLIGETIYEWWKTAKNN